MDMDALVAITDAIDTYMYTYFLVFLLLGAGFYDIAVAGQPDAPVYFSTQIPFVIGLLLAVVFACVLFGGTHRISVLTSVIVPAMAVLDDYKEQKACGLNPVFVADKFPGMPATECWHETREELRTIDENIAFSNLEG